MLPQRMLPRPGMNTANVVSHQAPVPAAPVGMAPAQHLQPGPATPAQRPVMGTNMGEIGQPWNFRFANRG